MLRLPQGWFGASCGGTFFNVPELPDTLKTCRHIHDQQNGTYRLKESPMIRKTLLVSIATIVATFALSGKVHAQGAYHYGYTHVGPNGVQHWGTTGVSGPYGSYGGAHT